MLIFFVQSFSGAQGKSRRSNPEFRPSFQPAEIFHRMQRIRRKGHDRLSGISGFWILIVSKINGRKISRKRRPLICAFRYNIQASSHQNERRNFHDATPEPVQNEYAPDRFYPSGRHRIKRSPGFWRLTLVPIKCSFHSLQIVNYSSFWGLLLYSHIFTNFVG